MKCFLMIGWVNIWILLARVEKYEKEALRKLVISELYESNKQTAKQGGHYALVIGNPFDGRRGDPFEQPNVIENPYILNSSSW